MFQSATGIYQTDICDFARYLQVCEDAGSALVDLPKPPTHHCKIIMFHNYKIIMISLLYRQHFGKWFTELAKVSPFCFSYVWCNKYASCCFSSDSISQYEWVLLEEKSLCKM